MAYIGKQITINGVIYTPLSADPSNPKEGQLFYSDGTIRAEGLWVYKNSNWSQVGAGVSDKSVYGQFDAEDQATTGFTNISVSGSGPINQDNSYLVSSFPASLPAVSLNSRNKLKENSVEFHYTLTSGTAKAVVKDQTAAIISEVELEATNNPQKVILSHFVTGAMSDLTLEFQDVSSATGLKFDDAIFSDDPFVYKNLVDFKNFYINQDGSALLNRTGDIRFNLATATTKDEEAVTPIDDAANTRTTFKVNGSGCLTVFTTYQTANSNDSTTVKRLDSSGSSIESYLLGKTATSADTGANTVSFNVDAGDLIVINANVGIRNTSHQCVVNFNLNQLTENVITPAKNQINEFSARIKTAGVTPFVESENTPWIQSVTKTAGGTFQIVFKPDFFTEIPAVDANAKQTNRTGNAYNETLTGCEVRTEETASGANVDVDFDLFASRQGADVKSAELLAAIPVQRTAYLKDVRASGTNGGNASTSFVERELNTIEGASSIVSLSSNKFTLPAGTYQIRVEAPAYEVNNHLVKLVQDPSGTPSDFAIGKVSHSGTGTQTDSVIDTEFTLTSSTTFNIQHRSDLATSGFGFGVAANYGVDEIYTTVKITKIK